MRRLICFSVLAVTLSLLSPAASLAQEALTQEQAVQAWDAATAELATIEKRLGEIQEKFPGAQPAEQQTLRTEAMDLFQKLAAQLKVIGRTAPQVYPSRAPKEKVEESKPYQLVCSALWRAYRENRYADAVRIADTLLAAHPLDALALNVGGASNYATQNFTRAVELLETAEKNRLLVPAVGDEHIAGNDPDTARKYVAYWEREAAIRAKESAAMGDAANPRVLLTTSKGDVLLELFEDQAPNTVANFISLVEKGYYDGSPFHRVIGNFMAQVGTPGKPARPGDDGPGYSIECECYRSDFRRHFGGTLSMAHAGKDTGGSQFFITHLPTAHLDGDPDPMTKHTVFGRVVEGLDVAAAIQQGDQIVSAKVVRKRNHPYVPKTHPDR
jgi:cyclophilin family peptidyl-prolyl cis-trans isomerase